MAVETVSDGTVSPMGVGMAIAASLNRFSAKLTNGVFNAWVIKSPAKPVQSTNRSPAMAGPSRVPRDAMAPCSSRFA